jgi:hypothetical protein
MAGIASWWRIDRVDFGEVFKERPQGEKTAHDTLICQIVSVIPDGLREAVLTVSKQRKVSACYNGDRHVELRARETIKLLHLAVEVRLAESECG